MKLTYKEFELYLKKDGYSAGEIAHLFNVIKAMDKESRIWVIRWFVNGTIPDIEVEGVTASSLIEKYGYKPLNAFIVLDWLKSDPQAAKYFILKIPATISPSDAIGDEMSKYVDTSGLQSVDDIDNKKDFLTD